MSTIRNVKRIIIATIAIVCIAVVVIPSVSAGINDGTNYKNSFKDIYSVQDFQNNRITKIDALGTKIEWKDISISNQWIPSIKSVKIEPIWNKIQIGSIQWNDKISDNLKKYSPFERTVTLEPAWNKIKLGSIQWNDKISDNLKKYSPFERTVTLEPGWNKIKLGSIQWNDKISDNLKKYSPWERIVTIGPSWARFTYTDKWNGINYEPFKKNFNIGSFGFNGIYNGKSYVPPMNQISKPMSIPSSSYSTISSYH